MNELSWAVDALKLIGTVYWLLALSALAIALWFPKTKLRKSIWTIVAIVLFSYLPTKQIWESRNVQARLQAAEAMFQERCKKAGEKIYRTAENVEGIVLLKIRPEGVNYGDQFAMTDPYGDDLGGDGYIRMFLRGSYTANYGMSGPIPGAPPSPKGYLYVESLDTKNGQRYRYTGRIDEPWKGDSSYSKTYKRFVLDKTPALGEPPRYAVTYDDISTREEREYWIAGSSLKIIDLKTNEVMAERVGYMMDRGQGNRGGGRSPWLFAADNACPSFQRNPLRPPGHGAEAQRRQTQYFAEKTLKPKLEN